MDAANHADRYCRVGDWIGYPGCCDLGVNRHTGNREIFPEGLDRPDHQRPGFGGVYALIALGYTLVYGVLKTINFAHSEVFMSGPFTATFAANALIGLGWWNKYPWLSLLIVTLVAAAVSTVIAILLERIAYRPLRTAPRLVPLITAIGASFFLQYTFRGLYGSGLKSFPEMKMLQGFWMIGDVRIFRTQAAAIGGAIIMMVVLYGIVQWTKLGKAMRSVSEDKEVAALMGINVDKVIVSTFAMGGAAAGVAGIFYYYFQWLTSSWDSSPALRLLRLRY